MSQRRSRVEVLGELTVDREIAAVGLAVHGNHIRGVLNKAFEGRLALPRSRDRCVEGGARFGGLA